MMMIILMILGHTVWTFGTLRQQSRRSSCTPPCQRPSLQCSCRPDHQNGNGDDGCNGDDGYVNNEH